MKTKSGVAFLVGLLVLCGLFSCANSVLDPALPDGVTDGDLDNADVELILVDGDADNDTERADLEAAETDAETDGPEAETSTDGDPERDAEPEAESSEADAEPDSDGESAAETDADTESEAPLLPFGEICTTSENCAAGLTCMTVLGTLRCSKSCADEGSLCPEGGECIDLTSRKTTVLKVCAKSDSIHQNTYMAACRGDWDCAANLVCPPVWGLCSKRCTASGECPSVSSPAHNLCVDPAARTQPGTRKTGALFCLKQAGADYLDVGAPCLVNDQCTSLICLQDPMGVVCSKTCTGSSTCPSALPNCIHDICQTVIAR